MTVLEDLGQYLQNNGIGTQATDMFLAEMPTTPNNLVSIMDTGGPTSSTHEPTRQFTFQIIVRNTDYATAMNKANAIRALLHTNDLTKKSEYDLVSGGTHIMTGKAIQEPYNLGQDEAQRYQIVTNYNFLTR